MSRIQGEPRTGRMAKCAHPICLERVPTSRFACKAHWFELPKAIRDRVWVAARAVWANRTSPVALRSLHEAHEAARAAWKGEE